MLLIIHSDARIHLIGMPSIILSPVPIQVVWCPCSPCRLRVVLLVVWSDTPAPSIAPSVTILRYMLGVPFCTSLRMHPISPVYKVRETCVICLIEKSNEVDE